MRKLILLLTVILLLSACGATKVIKLFHIIKSGQVETNAFKYEIPFEHKNGLFILKAKVNNAMEDSFILDSGAPVCLISDSIIKTSHLRKILDYNVSDVNNKTKKTGWYIADSISIGKLKFTKIGVAHVDFSNSPAMCFIQGGLLGMNVLDKCIWSIDFQNKKIILASCLDSIPYVKKGIRIPVYRDKTGYIYIDCKFNGITTKKLLFDLGWVDGFISVPMKDFTELEDSGKVIKSYGNGTGGAFSISQDTVYLKRTKTLSIEKINFANTAVTSGKESNFSLGNKILQYYYLTLNLKDNEIFLTPIPGKEMTSELQTFGLAFDYKEGLLTIGTLFQNGPAEKAGLMLNDTVLTVNERKLVFNDYCDFQDKNNELLKNIDSLTLKVMRNRAEKTFSFKKENIHY